LRRNCHPSSSLNADQERAHAHARAHTKEKKREQRQVSRTRAHTRANARTHRRTHVHIITSLTQTHNGVYKGEDVVCGIEKKTYSLPPTCPLSPPLPVLSLLSSVSVSVSVSFSVSACLKSWYAACPSLSRSRTPSLTRSLTLQISRLIDSDRSCSPATEANRPKGTRRLLHPTAIAIACHARSCYVRSRDRSCHARY
jgi:hypothetical protein